jgi:preprotein translocase subunit SecF
MIWGIVIGTYSTICVASPLLIYMHLHRIRGKESTDPKSKGDKPAQQGA